MNRTIHAHPSRGRWVKSLLLVLSLTTVCVAVDRPRSAPRLPEYVASTRHAGTIRSVGAWSLAPALGRWGEAYREMHPDFRINVESIRTADAIVELANGRSNLMPLVRPLTDEEIAVFRRITGHEPFVIDVSIEAVAIVVNRTNPLREISLTELDAVFSTSRRRGGERTMRWSDLGVEGDLAGNSIRLFGPDLNGAGHRFFRERVLDGGDFRTDISEQPGPSAIVNAAGAYRDAMGYCSRALPSRRARFVPISVDGADAIPLTDSTVGDGSYPLVRRLMVAINRPPGRPLDPLVRDFLQFVLSKQGQSIAAERGNVPLPPSDVVAERDRLD